MTRWTNEQNLPAPLVAAIENDDYESSGDISVTRLIKPPRIVQLEKRYAKDIVQDVSGAVWMLLGKAVHYVLERAGVNHTTEHKIEEEHVVEVMGWKLSGRLDAHNLTTGVLSDYKITSVWSFLKGAKPEWEAQLNVNAWLLRRHGHDVKRLEITAILRDWSVTRTYEPDYPQAAALTVEIPIWDDAKAEAYVKDRMAKHQAAVNVADDELPSCTAEERWEKPTTWAVQKPGAAKAWRVKDTEIEAKDLANQTKGMEVVQRPGESTRCRYYCSVLQFCQQGKWLVPPQDRTAKSAVGSA